MTSDPVSDEESVIGDLSAVDRVGRDPITNTYHYRYDESSADSFVAFVIGAVRETIDADPFGMSPLYYAVEPEVISALYRPQQRHRTELQFVWCDCDVTVTSDGEAIVQVREA